MILSNIISFLHQPKNKTSFKRHSKQRGITFTKKKKPNVFLDLKIKSHQSPNFHENTPLIILFSTIKKEKKEKEGRCLEFLFKREERRVKYPYISGREGRRKLTGSKTSIWQSKWTASCVAWLLRV